MVAESSVDSGQLPTGEVLVVGLVRNCARHVSNEVRQLQQALTDFHPVRWLVVESDSDDDSVAVLHELSALIPNFRYLALGNLAAQIPQRTARLAHCRNVYLDELVSSPIYVNVDYVVVSDLDGLNTYLTRDAIRSCWARKDWDVCTANQAGPYYDIWTLRHDDWSPNDCWKQHDFLSRYVDDHDELMQSSLYSRMIRIPPDSPWICVDSAFGGLAIYKREAIALGRYVGLTPDGREVSDHVALHSRLRANGCSIWINPALINSGLNEHSQAAAHAQKPAPQILLALRRLGRGLSRVLVRYLPGR